MADVANKYLQNMVGKYYVDDQSIDFMCLARRRRRTLLATAMADIRAFLNNRLLRRKNHSVRKQWKGVEAIGNDGK